MASSKVMGTTSTPNHDMPRQSSLRSSLSTLLSDHQTHERLVSGMSMDDYFMKNLYASDSPPPSNSIVPFTDAVAESNDGDDFINETKSVDEMWKEIVAGGNHQRLAVGGGGEMTLEDFLTKKGAVGEEDIRMSNQGEGSEVSMYGVDNNCGLGFGNGGIVVGETVRRASKRRLVEELPLDKATQQKQRRMIKNRESAARSRERKQAYTVELESLVTQLEDENKQLVREKVAENNARLKRIMERVIPVTESRKPPRSLRRLHSI